jgi:GDP-L-fucose synthase
MPERDGARFLLLGADGLLGEAVRRLWPSHPFSSRFELRWTGRGGYPTDLTDAKGLRDVLRDFNPSHVIHAAARVGNAAYNRERDAEMLKVNDAINGNVLRAAAECGVRKVVSFLPTCMFNDDMPQPWRESQLDGGLYRVDNPQRGYAESKRRLYFESRMRSREGVTRFVTLCFPSLYGLNDNYSWERGHVIPHLIRRFWEATRDGRGAVTLRGTGEARREFLFADDAARAAIWALERYDDTEETLIVRPPHRYVDIRSPKPSLASDISIRSLADLVASLMRYEGDILWDGIGDGQASRRTDAGKFARLCPGFAFTPFKEGLRRTVAHFIANCPNLRGMAEC